MPSVMTRSMSDVVQAVVDISNAGGSMVTVAAMAAALPKVMRRVGAHARTPAARGPGSRRLACRTAGTW